MLDTFLELGVPATDVAASLAFYESLGFVQASVGDAWPHAYAVVTDGRISIGLHGSGLEEPALTFVAPDMRSRLDGFDALGLEPEHVRLDDVSLNEIRFRDPEGQLVRLVEARTYSPPALEPGHESVFGYFEEYALGSRDPAASGRFWEGLGFVAFADDATRAVLCCRRDLNLAFRALDIDPPTLCFVSDDLARRVVTLRDQGLSFATHAPSGLDATATALLRGPDRVQVLLLQRMT